MGAIFNFLPKPPLALKSFLSLPPHRCCLLSLFSSRLMPISAECPPPLPLPASKQSPVVTPVRGYVPSWWLQGRPHAQKRAVGPAMPPAQLAWEQLGTKREWAGLWSEKETAGKGMVIPSLGFPAYFGKLDSCTFWF